MVRSGQQPRDRLGRFRSRRANPEQVRVGGRITIPAGVRHGMGFLKAAVPAEVEARLHRDDGSVFYRLRSRDKRGRERTHYYDPNLGWDRG